MGDSGALLQFDTQDDLVSFLGGLSKVTLLEVTDCDTSKPDPGCPTRREKVSYIAMLATFDPQYLIWTLIVIALFCSCDRTSIQWMLSTLTVWLWSEWMQEKPALCSF